MNLPNTPTNDSEQETPNGSPKAIPEQTIDAIPKSAWIVFAVLLVIAPVLAFGDFGFDHPGRLGLDFGHHVLLLLIATVTSLIGFTKAFTRRSLPFAALVMAGMLLCLVGVLIGG
ncbi:MAG: hypothetical protein HQ518_23630 [Rhodopirellula sp.]|nr:hypothetical protein [Rhodopirellula sp.]